MLTSEVWEEFTVIRTGKKQFKAKGKDLFMLKTDILLLDDDEFDNPESLKSIVADFAFDNYLFLETFASAWRKIMNADRVNGPTSNSCADAVGAGFGGEDKSTGA